MDSRMSEVTFCCCCWNCNENNVHIHSQKKRYKSCHWGCFQKVHFCIQRLHIATLVSGTY